MAATLADVLFADKTDPLVLEEDWVKLVRGIAAGDESAFLALYERTHRLVFTLTTRITNSRKAAEEVTLNVFYDVWRRSSTYKRTGRTVLAWVMNQARARAVDRLQSERLKKRDPHADIPACTPGDPGPIDITLFSDVTRLEIAARAGGKRDADVIHTFTSLWGRLARRIAEKPRDAIHQWIEPDWKEVASGVSCKLLATDIENDLVSMLVRLAPGVDYPPHTHAGVEELHLLQGDLWIDGRKLYPGDYNRGKPGSTDDRVWSVTGCTGVLITSTRDALNDRNVKP
jgi:DNA-directed RNA polymerase specialized sigma24 family protein